MKTLTGKMCNKNIYVHCLILWTEKKSYRPAYKQQPHPDSPSLIAELEPLSCQTYAVYWLKMGINFLAMLGI